MEGGREVEEEGEERSAKRELVKLMNSFKTFRNSAELILKPPSRISTIQKQRPGAKFNFLLFVS